MIYLTVDGMLSGTGVRDTVNGGYLPLETLAISQKLRDKISQWVGLYEYAHYRQFADEHKVKALDAEGLEIRAMIKVEIVDSKVEYFSSATMEKIYSFQNLSLRDEGHV